MAVPQNEIDPNAVPRAVDKSTAERVGKWALKQEKTAAGAARAINQSGYANKVRGHYQDNFDTKHPEYELNDDWAGQAEDKKWLIVRKHPEPSAPTTQKS